MSCGISSCIYSVWNSLGFLNLGGYFLPHFREYFDYCLLKYFLIPFPLVSFWDTYGLNVWCLSLSQLSLKLMCSFMSFIFIIFFFLFCFIYFHHSIFQITYYFFCLSYSTVGPLQSVLIPNIALFTTD